MNKPPRSSGRRLPRRSSLAMPIRTAIESLESRWLMTAAPVTVDPSDGLRLTGSTVLGDWTTDGSTAGWSVTNAASSSVAGGAITATSNANGTPLDVSLAALASGPNLDYGYNYFAQVRLQLPAGYNHDVAFLFGTTTKTGFASDREFVIPAAQIAQDGAFHTYRVDLGLQVSWKDSLRDFRVELPGTSSADSVSVDYVEVGDKPNDTYLVNTSAAYMNMAPGVTATSRQSIESKHFVFWYDPAVNPGGRTNWTTIAHNILHMLEESSQVYTKVLGFKDVFNYASATTRYKMNITSWYSGYWSAGTYMNVDTSGGQDEGSGNPVPHEFGHATDSANMVINGVSYVDGGHWESHANWYREQWIHAFSPYFSASQQSTFIPSATRYSNLRIDDQRLIYADWRVYTPLEEYATSLGLNANAAALLWQTGTVPNQTLVAKLAATLPAGVSIKDVMGTLMQYWPTFDFDNGANMKLEAFPTAASLADYNFQSTSYLEPEADKPGWYRVPDSRAPEKYAYMTHVLTPTAGSTSISVTFAGLPSNDSGADWRWSLQAVGANGVVRYSPLYGNNATGTLAILPTDTKVMLVVTATPANTNLDLTSHHNTKQDTQDPDRLTYPYELTMTGATPATGAALRIAYTRGSGRFWTNPDGTAGGWVDNSATVASTVYIAPGAQVLGSANISGSAKMLDFATVSGSARVSGNAVVSGYAVVNGTAQVSSNARVRDFAMVTGNAIVSGNAVIEDYATLNSDLGQPTVTDNAVVRGVAIVQGGTLSGSAIAEYDYTFNWSMSDGTHSNNYPYDADWINYYEASQAKPRGLIASYRVNETSGQMLFDEFGTLNGLIRGTATRANDATRNSNVLSLDGSTQYATLDRSVAALTDGTYSIWVKPTAATADQPLLYFGSSANTYLKLVARDANGFAHLTISVNGVVRELVSSVAVPLNAWTNLTVTFAGTQATIYVNGTAAGTAPMTYRPTDVLTSGSFGSAQSIFLGRDAAGNSFTGSVDDFRVYNVALSASEIASEAKRSGTILGTAYTSAPVTFSNSVAESGVHDGQTRTISAWIRPNTSASVNDSYYNTAYYTPIVDSTDERHASGNASRNGSGLGTNNGFFVAKLDGAGMWNTGVAVSLGQWQQVTLTFNGSVANFYVNGVLRATKSYTVSVANIAGKNYRIGYGQTTTDATSRTYFDGQIFDLEIADRVVAPTTTLPAGWTTTDVGTVGATGTAAFNTGNWALTGSGVGVTGTADAFRFASTSVSGDATLTALVTKPAQFSGTTNSAATAGVMFRSTTATNASDVMLALTPAGSIVFQYRATAGGATTTVATQTGITGPVWLRLTRSTANGVSAFYSTDGVNFTQIGSTVGTLAGAALPSTLLAGLAVTSRASATLAQALFAGVSVVSNPAPTIATPATATLDAGGKSATLSVLGADNGGEAALTYVWTAVGTLPGPVSFSDNSSNSAKTATVALLNSGTYTFVVSIFDGSGAVVSSTPVTLTLTPVVASIGPASASVIGGGTQQFTALDQYGQPIASNLVTWSTTVGSINAAGLFTAPATGTSATISAAVAGSSPVTTNVTIAGPRLWLKNDTIVAGNTAVADSSGNNRNGTLSATTGFSSTAGEIGNALTLSGATVTLPAAAISTSTDFTVAAWVKLSSLNNWARLFDFGTGTTKYMFLTPYDGAGHVRFAITTGGGGSEQLLDSTTTLATGVWTHLAVTLSGTSGTLYVNGAAVATNANMTLNPAALGITTAYLGKSFYGDPNLQGSIDDFRIYGTAASAATVASMYAAGATAATAAPTNVNAVASNGRVDVSWSDNSSIETGYLIERSTSASFTSNLISFTVAANNTTYADTSVAGGTTYYYRVTTVLPTAVTAGPVNAPAVTTPVAATVISSAHQYQQSPDTLTFVFSTDIGSAAFSVGSLTVLAADNSTVTVTGYSYVPTTHSAIFTLATSLADGNYTATLAKGSTLAADATLPFFVLAGDADHDRSIGFSDLLALARNYGKTSGVTAADGDFNFDGSVDFSDLLLLARKYGTTLAAATPQAAVVAAPTTATTTRRTALAASVIS